MNGQVLVADFDYAGTQQGSRPSCERSAIPWHRDIRISRGAVEERIADCPANNDRRPSLPILREATQKLEAATDCVAGVHLPAPTRDKGGAGGIVRRYSGPINMR